MLLALTFITMYAIIVTIYAIASDRMYWSLLASFERMRESYRQQTNNYNRLARKLQAVQEALEETK